MPLPNYYPEDRVRRDGTIALRVGTRFKIFILTPGRHTRRFTEITFNTRTAEDPRTTHTLSFTANTKSSLLLMSRADAWLRAASTGHCGATSDVGDCNTGTRGSMGLSPAEASNWTIAVSSCLHRCDRCPRCNFITVSLHHQDCSWYHRCEATQHDVFCLLSGPSRPTQRSILEISAAAPELAQAASWKTPASIAILQVSNQPPPLPVTSVVELRDGKLLPVPRLGGHGIRSLAATVNRVYAGLHGYTYVYARVPEGCGRRFAAWCALPAILGLLQESRTPIQPQAQRNLQSHHRFSWVLQIDEDVAFHSVASFPSWLALARTPLSQGFESTATGRSKRSCRGRCLPSQLLRDDPAALLDSVCPEDGHVSTEPTCLMVTKDIGGWPGANAGVKFVRASPHGMQLIKEWWQWPLGLPTRQVRTEYLDAFPGDQNALNDAILKNANYSRCLHVAPNADLYGKPGRYTRHYTGVHADKEGMFLADHSSRAQVNALLSFPEWNATACAPSSRSVRLPAVVSDDNSLSYGHREITIEYTPHCHIPPGGGVAAATELLKQNSVKSGDQTEGRR